MLHFDVATLLSFWFLTSSCECSIQVKPTRDSPRVPLILTPLIKSGKTQEAKTACEVKFKEFKEVTSYSGFFTVNKAFNSNLFFWYFPSETEKTEAPVVLWLQGGPGTSSLMGLFQEHGPFSVTRQQKIKKRMYYWTKNHSVIYIDNPVGTGFSFTDNGYAQNETQVGEELYNALQQFFTIFPELQKRDFFISGESYAGKYVPAIAHTIQTKNPTANLKINLKGITLGNANSVSEDQLDYGNHLYKLGFIDSNTKKEFQKRENQIKECIQNKDWSCASHNFDRLILGLYSKEKTLLQNVTGLTSPYNLLFSKDTASEKRYMAKYVQRDDVRAALHVGNVSYNVSSLKVALHLKEDFMKSVAQWISELLDDYRVLTYNGQLDLAVPYTFTVNYLKKLNFSGASEYKTAPRHRWYVDDELAGYVKQAGNLTEILVRNCGHLVPTDQPVWALDLITRFTRNKPFH